MGSQSLLDKLTSKYDKLTPYERAVLTLKEATGRRRQSVIESVAECKTPWEAYWTEHWRHAILTTTFFAVHSGLAKLAASLAKESGGECGAVLSMECTAWLDALRQLERETGTPFREAAKLLPGPDLLAEIPTDPDVPHALEYRNIRQVWDAYCDNPNRTDAHRALPPLPKQTDEEREQWSEYRMLVEGARPALQEKTTGESETVIYWIPDNCRIHPGPGMEVSVDFSRLSEAQIEKLRTFFAAEARGEVEKAHGHDWTSDEDTLQDRL